MTYYVTDAAGNRRPMTARERVAAVAGGGQPRRRWELVSGASGTKRDTYRRDDGYRVEVWFTAADSVRCANLRSPAGAHRYVFHRNSGKLQTVLAWLDDAEVFTRPPCPVGGRQ